MTKHVEKVKDSISLSEFSKTESNQLNDYYSIYNWLIDQWKLIIGSNINIPPHINRLYIDGIRSFFYMCYSASILTITTTVELTLKTIIDLNAIQKKKRNFDTIINEAINQKIISKTLGEDIHNLRKNTRNRLIHEQRMAPQMAIGWEKDPESKTGYMLTDNRLNKLAEIQKESRESLFISLEVFTKEAIILLFKVFRSCLDSGRNWSDF